MQITITVPDALVAQVESLGLDVKSYAQELINRLASQELAKTQERREAVEAMLCFADEYGFTLGTSDLKSTMHEGHKSY